jgi:DNA-binding transcriptional MerR regulator
VRIGELSRRTGIPARMLRYYEEQGLLRPDRAENGYRWYDGAAVDRARQIRGLLDAGLTSEIIRHILPCLAGPQLAPALPPETVELIRHELDRVQQRIDCLRRNRDAIRAYLGTVTPAAAPD